MAFADLNLTVANVTLARGSRTLAEGVSFAARGGELTLLAGPNGTGKTTLLRAIAGLTPVQAGRIELSLGGAAAEAVGPACHWLGHLDGVRRMDTVLAQTQFWARFWGARADVAQSALVRVGLAALAPLPARALSAGQRRRLALARLLIAPRPVWLLDEPTGGLDVGGRELLGALMAEHLSAGGAIIAASHEPLPLSARRTLRFAALDSARVSP